MNSSSTGHGASVYRSSKLYCYDSSGSSRSNKTLLQSQFCRTVVPLKGSKSGKDRGRSALVVFHEGVQTELKKYDVRLDKNKSSFSTRVRRGLSGSTPDFV